MIFNGIHLFSRNEDFGRTHQKSHFLLQRPSCRQCWSDYQKIGMHAQFTIFFHMCFGFLKILIFLALTRDFRCRPHSRDTKFRSTKCLLRPPQKKNSTIFLHDILLKSKKVKFRKNWRIIFIKNVKKSKKLIKMEKIKKMIKLKKII